MTNDGAHSYTYDAEGNITQVDGGSTAIYTYNALNQRVRTAAGTATEYVFNTSGQRVSEWNATTHAQLKGHYYWGGKPVAYYDASATHFEHQDWMGTERARTSYNGTVEGTYGNLPFGDGRTTSGTDGDPYHYAVFDHDSESDTDHAEFRQYSNTQGRFLSPDPYDGSYNAANPQSFNRHTYALNSPLSNIDPRGLDCAALQEDGSIEVYTGDCPGYDPNNEYYVDCDGCLTAAQAAGAYGYYDADGNLHITNVGYNNGSFVISGANYTQSPWIPNFTLNFGLAANYTFWGFSGTIGAGFVVDSSGNSGTYYDFGLGVGEGAGFSAGVQLAGSNGNSICAKGGPFTNVSGTFGAEGAAGTADYFTGSGDAPGGTVRGGGVTAGVGGGVGASTSVTTTTVTPFGNQTCNQDGKIQ